MKHKIISILLAACMAASALAVGSVQASASEFDPKLAQDSVQGGAILHCFNWSYDNIREALPDIAAAGYTAVQTSPVQPPKDRWESSDVPSSWWKMYQPLDLAISDDNARYASYLGTKQQLTQLCDTADAYDIKVVVDIVANHLANNGTDGGTFSYLSHDVARDMQDPKYYHGDPEYVSNYNDRYELTQRHMGKPDLNTSDDYVKQKVLTLLEDCVDCGVDGFRFDAAKHIELPDDEYCGSNFWPTVINGVKDYAGSTYGKTDLFFYGEILGGAGTDISNYTRYMAVTDDVTGNDARNNANSQNSGGLSSGWYNKGTDPKNCVLWAESHDTYEHGASNGISNDVIVKTWAIVGSRNDSTSLFFARPATIMGDASSDPTWKSTAVAEVNKFKNFFDGQSEYLDSSYSTTYNVRGDSGVVISKLDGAGDVDLDAHGMKNGTYTDHVSQNSFTVENGRIKGTVDGTGVAVVYNDKKQYIDADTLCLVPNDNWKKDGARFAMYLFNNTTGAYTWADMKDDDSDGTYTAAVPGGKWEKVIFCRMNGGTTENKWDNKWNQTNDLIPDNGTNCYSVAHDAWDNGGGSWSYSANAHTSVADGNPVWVWEDDYSSATATFNCTLCNSEGHQNVQFIASGDDISRDYMHTGRCIYTATVDVDGRTFSDSKSVLLSKPELAATSISLKEEIGVNFYINVPLNTDVSSATVTYKYDANENWQTGKLVKKGGLYIAVCDVPAVSMTENVDMVFICGGNQLESFYSVVDYATDAAALFENDNKLKALLCNMLEYGGAAQTHFGYNTYNLASTSKYISRVDPNWNKPGAADLGDDMDTSTIQDTDLSNFGLKFKGAALSVTARVTVRLFFEVTDDQTFENTSAAYGDTALTFSDYDGMKYIELTGIAASDIFKDHTVTFTNGSDNTEAVYNPVRYYNKVMNSDSFEYTVKDVMAAMYRYSSSATEYLS